MFKVLIVDDEEITREGLCSFVPWEELGMEVAAVAADGQEGLEAALRVVPDIALCDVRMPKKDGIGLAKELRAQLPGCKIIFLSGYSEVEYLRSAIQLQAIDYVEKPVDMEQLQAVLLQAAEACRKERDAKARLEEMELQVSQARPYRTGKTLQAMLSGSGTAAELEAEWRELYPDRPAAGSYSAFVLKLQDRRKQAAMVRKLEETLPHYDLHALWCEWEQVLACVCDMGEAGEKESIVLAMNAMTAYCRDVLHTGLSVGIGEAAAGMEGITVSMEQAQEALQLEFYRGWGSVIPFGDATRGVRPKRVYEKETFLRFEKLLQRQDFEEAAELLSEVGDELRRLEASGISAIRKRLFKLYIVVSKVFPDAVAEPENGELWGLFAQGRLEEILAFLQGQLEAIKDGLTLLATQPDKTVIREAVAYINNHYQDDLSIDAIAKQVFLTPTYFCLLFKKELSISVNEYITQVRIEKAKQLLKDRSLKLYEIAQKVGYSDPNYFAKVFRKLTGAKPSEYRETSP
ncbi:response regulator [Paenibacillus sp. GD4]|uniref:response regulator n=1 Tax=Paenibacillus sp. GD4 TaxID=3068890 RepID=UPI002796DB98|nr:response regulator [Paenibacillus sp. GD4]MDQ1910278.1 response regulator [Paenibacillus sp. GD4]